MGKKRRRTKGPDTALKLPQGFEIVTCFALFGLKTIRNSCLYKLSVTPHTKCRLKLLKLERIKDYLLMEEEYIRNQERLKPQEEKNEVCSDEFNFERDELSLINYTFS